MRVDLYQDLYETEDTHWWHRAKRAVVEWCVRTYSKKNPAILDVGCGAGKTIEMLQTHGRVAGIDSSPDAITFCRKRGIQSVMLASIEELPFSDEKLDVITALDVLEHVSDGDALKEVYRVLRPGGIIIITVPAFQWLWSEWDTVLHHKRRYTKGSLHKVLKQAGFSILKSSYLHSFLVLPVFVLRKIKSIVVAKKQYSSDFGITSPPINHIMLFVSKLEQWFVKRYDIPLGTSIICVAQKKQQPPA